MKQIKAARKNSPTNVTNDKFYKLLLKLTMVIQKNSSSAQVTVGLNKNKIMNLVVAALFRSNKAKIEKEVLKADNLGKSITTVRVQATAQTHVRFFLKIALIRSKLKLFKILQLVTLGTVAPISIPEQLDMIKIKI